MIIKWIPFAELVCLTILALMLGGLVYVGKIDSNVAIPAIMTIVGYIVGVRSGTLQTLNVISK